MEKKPKSIDKKKPSKHSKIDKKKLRDFAQTTNINKYTKNEQY